ncbi:MAG: hypothetical protein Q4B63_04675 [Clostridium perfringens]|nr:hypothetical protein [Clostridium perfringens]
MDFEQLFKEFYSDFQNESGKSGLGCDDIPGGFQDLNPEFFTMIGSLLGQIAANNMPFNVQYAIGNWLQLLSQVILAYNAQQQYLQNGPGRYYDIRNKNINNSECESSKDSSKGCDCKKELYELKKHIKVLYEEIDRLKNKDL